MVIKGGPLSRSGARRHGLRALLLRAPSPATAEFLNLTWLRERLFRVPRPLGAVTISRRGFPVTQILATELVPEAVPLDAAWGELDDANRLELAAELGREVGRMHALRFSHGDLYPRNVLLAPPVADGSPGHGRRLVWIDCWAAGPTPWRRGYFRRVEQDLGAWFSCAAEFMDAETTRACLGQYIQSRRQNGRPVTDLGEFVARVQRARRDELVRLEKDRRRLRGAPFPVAGWDPSLTEVRALTR